MFYLLRGDIAVTERLWCTWGLMDFCVGALYRNTSCSRSKLSAYLGHVQPAALNPVTTQELNGAFPSTPYHLHTAWRSVGVGKRGHVGL